MTDTAYGIADVAQATGLSKDALRWYEREGLIPSVDRGPTGRRTYDGVMLRFIRLLVRLRRTGMPVAESREFLKLYEEGAATHGRRMALLTSHRERIVDRIASLHDDLALLDDKIAHYGQLIEAGLDCDNQPIVEPAILTDQRRTA